jgi:hypothetical protein
VQPEAKIVQRPESLDKAVPAGLMLLWPAFLTACLLEMLVFAVVDPGEVNFPAGFFHATRLAVYTWAFFVFWVAGMGCSAMVLWLLVPQGKRTVNDTSGN